MLPPLKLRVKNKEKALYILAILQRLPDNLGKREEGLLLVKTIKLLLESPNRELYSIKKKAPEALLITNDTQDLACTFASIGALFPECFECLSDFEDGSEESEIHLF